jgi:hypothetical protein
MRMPPAPYPRASEASAAALAAREHGSDFTH